MNREEYLDATYDMFLGSISGEAAESARFGEWRRAVEADDLFGFDTCRRGAQRPEVGLTRTTGRALEVINLSSYNYLGLGYHPDVIEAAKRALDQYGLGAASSPVHGGTLGVHAELRDRLLSLIDLPDRGASIFSSGYAVNTGTLTALVKKHDRVLLDRAAHMSMLEGAQLSRAHVAYFEHNDADELAALLDEDPGRRTLVCTEGVFSADGDFGSIGRIVEVSKSRGAKVLVDEAHSFGVAGARGCGVAEVAGVLDEVDLLVLTFSKALGGVGGAVVAKNDIARYIDWYARCRMFSCAIDPAVSGGVAKALEIVASAEGAARRARVEANAAHLRARLAEHVDLGRSESWIVTVQYGDEALTLPLLDHLQRAGLDASVMQFPAAPIMEARLRLFVTSEHTTAQLDRAAELVRDAATRFGFARA